MKLPTSQEIAKKMVQKYWTRFDELKSKPKLSDLELKELVRLRQTLIVLKGQ
jgi:hypothetical protein